MGSPGIRRPMPGEGPKGDTHGGERYRPEKPTRRAQSIYAAIYLSSGKTGKGAKEKRALERAAPATAPWPPRTTSSELGAWWPARRRYVNLTVTVVGGGYREGTGSRWWVRWRGASASSDIYLINR